MKQVKVLHYAPGFLSGGIESRLLDWYRNIDRTKVKFCLIKLNDIDDTHNIREFIELGGEVYNLPKINIKNLFKFLTKLNKVMRVNSFDVIHVHDISSGVFALAIAKVNHIKLRIMHSRTTDYLPNEKNVFIKKACKKIIPIFANNYFACSYEAGIWGFGKKRANSVKVIKNGIQIEKFIYDPKIKKKIREELGIKNQKVIGTIGRLSAQKNLDFLIDLFKEINKEDNNTILVIVGGGNRRDELLKKAKELSLEENVIFTGERSNVWDYYMSFDVFLGTSLYEGFGTTAIESQAVGIPTILSKGFPETVCITELAERIGLEENIEVWKSTILKAIKSTRNRNVIDKIISEGYSVKGVAKELENIYLEVLKN